MAYANASLAAGSHPRDHFRQRFGQSIDPGLIAPLHHYP